MMAFHSNIYRCIDWLIVFDENKSILQFWKQVLNRNLIQCHIIIAPGSLIALHCDSLKALLSLFAFERGSVAVLQFNFRFSDSLSYCNNFILYYYLRG